MIYLDTHVAVWLYAFGAKKLSKRASVLIERSSKLLISPMVLLELEFLHEIGKLAVAPQALCGYLADRYSAGNLPKGVSGSGAGCSATDLDARSVRPHDHRPGGLE